MYRVIVSRRAERDISRLPDGYARLASDGIAGLRENPYPRNSKKLVARANYSLRIGVYRVIYGVNRAQRTVMIARVIHRSRAYR